MIVGAFEHDATTASHSGSTGRPVSCPPVEPANGLLRGTQTCDPEKRLCQGERTSVPEPIAKYRVQIYLAPATSASGLVEVVEEDITPVLRADQLRSALLTALRSVAATSGLSTTAETAKTSFELGRAKPTSPPVRVARSPSGPEH